MRRTGNGALHDGGMLHQNAFNFKRADTITGRLNDVVGSSNIPEIAVLILPGSVAGVVQTVVPGLLCLFRIVIVAFEQTNLLFLPAV